MFSRVRQINVARQLSQAVSLSVVIQASKHMPALGFAILEFFTSALKMRKREREAEKKRGERDKGRGCGREGEGEKMNE